MILKQKLIWLLFVLAACSSRGEIGYSEISTQAKTIETVLVAINRVRDETGEFGRRRSKKISFERFQISIPDSHTTGQVEWPSGPLNPATDFAVVKRTALHSAPEYFKERDDLSHALVAILYPHQNQYRQRRALVLQ